MQISSDSIATLAETATAKQIPEPVSRRTCLRKNDIVVPAKGYFRQDCENNYSAGKTWVNPNAEGVNKTVKVFNASIAMNWDELEDLARLLSQANINKNTHGRTTAAGRSEATDYGYYNQWSNDYVRSVGGDFFKDLTGEGTWAF